MKTLKTLFIVFAIVASYSINAQVAVSSDGSSADGSAMLDVKSTDKGFLPPRMTNAEISAISNPAEGLIVYSNEESKPFYYDGTEWKGFDGTSTLPIPLEIGDFANGGVVFYLDGSGGGLVCAVTDQSTGIQWYNNETYVITGASGTALGTGGTNTTAIITVQGATATDYAAGLARAHDGGGYNDWFLPSKDELNLMYLNIGQGNALGLGNIGNFANEEYWSSSEIDNLIAWLQLFDNGNQYNYIWKWKHHNVRAVRAF